MSADTNQLRTRPGVLLPFTALARSVRHPILWVATWAAISLLSLAPALAALGVFEGLFEQGTADWRTLREVGAGLTADTWTLSENFRHDNREALAQLSTANAWVMAALSAAALLLGVFAAGGWLQIAYERLEGKTFRRFCYGGAAYFWRFLRILVMVLLALALARWVCYGTPWNELVLGRLMGVPEFDRARLETLESELLVARLGWAQDGLGAALFALVLAWGAYTRTRIAQRDGRSVLGAGLATIWVLLRHPIQTLRPVFGLLLLEALVCVAAAGWLVDHIDARADARPRIEHVLALLAVVQAAALWRHLSHGALYFATSRVSEHLIPPHKKKGNPWEVTIGAPGGPQYPIGPDEDAYHVAL